jgi:hypothetical protein
LEVDVWIRLHGPLLAHVNFAGLLRQSAELPPVAHCGRAILANHSRYVAEG